MQVPAHLNVVQFSFMHCKDDFIAAAEENRRTVHKVERSARFIPVTTMPHFSPLEDTIISLPCFEPNSHRLELTGDMLTQHVLLTGASGYGKTTLLNRMLKDIVSYRSSEPAHKIGLLILDLKADQTSERVGQWAKEVGRADDIVVLSAESEVYYDLFAGLRTFEDVETICAKFTVFGNMVGADNAYWEQSKRTYLETALYFALLSRPSATFQEMLVFLNAFLVCEPGSSKALLEREEGVDVLSQLCTIAAQASHPFAMKAASLLSNYNSWIELDSKTRSNLTSIFANMLQPFFAMAAQSLFSSLSAHKRVRLNLSQALSAGKIVVLSVNAIATPELANALGMMLKCDFYQTVMSRPEQRNGGQRLLGLIADEYPLVVTGRDPRFGDVTQLQVMRSRGGFLIACTQGLVNIDIQVSTGIRSALLVNFANWFMLHSNEPELDQRATIMFGTVESTPVRVDTGYHDSFAPAVARERQLQERLVCPPGALGRLEQHQAYISLANGFKTPTAYWLVPLFAGKAATRRKPTNFDEYDLKSLLTELKAEFP